MKKCALCDKDFDPLVGRSTMLCNKCYDPFRDSTVELDGLLEDAAEFLEMDNKEEIVAVTRQCDEPGCSEEFEPTCNRQKFCPEHSRSHPNKPSVPSIEPVSESLENPSVTSTEPVSESPVSGPRAESLGDVIDGLIHDRRDQIKFVEIQLLGGITITIKEGS